MPDEFVAITGCHRKQAVRLLGQCKEANERTVTKGRRMYDEVVRHTLIVVWEASDRICVKRLKAALPSMVESLQRHRHLDLGPGVRRRLFSVSAAIIDRLLGPIRKQTGRKGRWGVVSRYAPSLTGRSLSLAILKWILWRTAGHGDRVVHPRSAGYRRQLGVD